MRSVDGISTARNPRPIARQATVATHVRPLIQSVPPPPKTTASLPPQVPTRQKQTKAFRASKRRERWQSLQTPFIILLGVIGGFLAQTTWFGVVAIAIYGILAFILRVPSRTSFMLAALSMAAVCSMLLFRPDPALAGAFTTYAFLFLVIGVIAIGFEARPKARRKKRRKGR